MQKDETFPSQFLSNYFLEIVVNYPTNNEKTFYKFLFTPKKIKTETLVIILEDVSFQNEVKRCANEMGMSNNITNILNQLHSYHKYEENGKYIEISIENKYF